jgi:hypothetical protein
MDKPELTAHVEGDAPHRDSLDSVTREAVGGHSTEDLPKNYFRSPQYIGSFIASAQFLRRQGSITDQYLQSMAFAYQGAFLGYVMPANVLTIIDKDLGRSFVSRLCLLLNSGFLEPQGQVRILSGCCWYTYFARP